MGHFLPSIGLILAITWIGCINAYITTRDENPISGQSPFTEDLDKSIQENMDFWHVPGIAIAVVDNDDIFTQVYGVSELPDKKVTPETLFYGGSTTKAQTAACLSMLINNGSYEALAQGWQTNISSILKDEFILQDQWATDHVTLQDAVGHYTGIPRHDLSLRREKDGKPLSTADMVQNLRNLPFNNNEPRVKFRYSNYMYITLSYVIEKLTNESLDQVIKELIWDPLEMKSTYYGLEQAQNSPQELAKGYIWINETQTHNQTTYMPATDLAGAAAVISNVGDYAKWLRAIINETQALSEDILIDMRTPRTIENPIPGRNIDVRLYGLGWFRSTFRGRVFYSHGGVMIGFRAQVYWFPDDKYGFVIFANSEDSDVTNNVIIWELLSQRFNVPKDELIDIPASRAVGKSSEERFNDAVAKNYPNCTMSDSSFNTKDLEGIYVNEGYGTLSIVSDETDNMILVSRRPDMTADYGFRFRRACGDNWLAAEGLLANLKEAGQFHPSEFVKGDDGKPVALNMKIISGNEVEASITFTKTG